MMNLTQCAVKLGLLGLLFVSFNEIWQRRNVPETVPEAGALREGSSIENDIDEFDASLFFFVFCLFVCFLAKFLFGTISPIQLRL